MQAVAVYPQGKTVRFISDHPEPLITSSTQVKVRMEAVGICGTDREIVEFKYGTPPPGSDHLVLGHECLGQVIEVGEAVTTIIPGEYVVVMVRRPCPHSYCNACRAGRPDFCYTGDFTERGIKEAHGFLTERFVEDEAYLVRVPPELSDLGVLTEPLTIAEKALQQVQEVQDRTPWTMPNAEKNVVVFGGGPTGLLAALLFASRNYRTLVYSLEPESSNRAKSIRSAGIEYISAENTSIPELAEAVRTVDIVYEATGAAQASFEMLSVLAVNGIFVFTGVPGRKETIEWNAASIMKDIVLKNLALLGTVNAGKSSYPQAVLDLAEFNKRWPHTMKSLITHRFSMADFAAAIDAPGIKNVVTNS